MRRLFALCLIIITTFAGPGSAAVKPNPLISDGMVLQRGRKVPLWGTANPGEKVTVSFQCREATTTAKDGLWTVWLDKLEAGGPFELMIRGDNVVRIKDVYVGEVWLCAGQMNMDWPLWEALDGEAAVKGAQDPALRLFQVHYANTPKPASEVQGSWKESTPESAAHFSAVAYFFGRSLRKQLGVPVGLIQATTGTSTADAWVARPTLARDPKARAIVQKYDDAEREYVNRVARYLDEYHESARKAAADGKDAPPGRPPENPFREWDRPAGLFNGMVAPLTPYGLCGVVWYQGESDVGRSGSYEALLTAVVQGWRTAWKRDELPFLIVQLAPAGRPRDEPHGSAWAEVRAAQAHVCGTLARCALVVTADLGRWNDIHQPDKLPVGARLALAAGATVYDGKESYTGPVFQSFKVENAAAVVQFTDASGGLGPRDGPVRGFTLAGDDGRFVQADAVVRDGAVVVSCPRVPRPTAVRYDWADYPEGNLAGRSGLPAAPFRTDDFPLLTEALKPDDAPTRPLTQGVPESAIKVRIPDVQQRDGYSCGAAALMAVCSYYGVGPEDLNEFKTKLGTNEENGTNVYEIRKMARELGLDAEIRHDLPLDELRKRLDEGSPVIVSIQAYGDPQTYYRDDNGHYITAIGYDENNFYFEDAVLQGRRGFLPAKEFDQRWHDDEGTAEKPDPHAHLGVVIRRKPGQPAKTPQARKID